MVEKFTRREYAVAGVGLLGSIAGCLDQSTDTRNDDSMTWQTGLHVKDTDSLQTEQLNYSIDIENRDRYPVEPLKLSITLRNTGETELRVGDIRTILFEQATSDSYILVREGLLNGSGYEYNDDAHVWISTSQVARTTEYVVTPISPGQEISTTVLVLHQQVSEDKQPTEIETLRTPQTFTNSFTVESASPSVSEEYQFTVHYQE